MRARSSALSAGEFASSQYLLVTALQRAVALAQMDAAPMAVAEHLDLDVARLLEIFLDVDSAVTEGSPRFSAAPLASACRGRLRTEQPSCRARRRRADALMITG